MEEQVIDYQEDIADLKLEILREQYKVNAMVEEAAQRYYTMQKDGPLPFRPAYMHSN